MSKSENELTIKSFPLLLVILAFVFIGVGISPYVRGEAQSSTYWLSIGAGVLLLLLSTIYKVTANRITRTLTISRRGLLHRFYKEIPFSEIKAIQLGATRESRAEKSTYRIEVLLNNGDIIPFRKSYSSGRRGKEKKAEHLREFIGIGGVGFSASGMLQAAKSLVQPEFKTEQESITGSQDQIYETKGVRWQLQTSAFGASPVSRWYSADYKLPEHFLYLTQKMEEQKDIPSNKLMQAMYEKLFEQSLKIYGFRKPDTPNLDAADLYPLDAHLKRDFFAYTSDKAFARKILNPWAERPLANWAHQHPFKQGSTDQLVVLFSPQGLYLAVMGYINQEYLDELANLGAELVRAQGN